MFEQKLFVPIYYFDLGIEKKIHISVVGSSPMIAKYIINP